MDAHVLLTFHNSISLCAPMQSQGGRPRASKAFMIMRPVCGLPSLLHMHTCHCLGCKHEWVGGESLVVDLRRDGQEASCLLLLEPKALTHTEEFIIKKT